jgi:ABC-type nitrate/sulfonate/bicarbonate transport system substrate-binding protein
MRATGATGWRRGGLRRAALVAGALLAMCGGVAACGSDDNSGASESGSSGGAESAGFPKVTPEPGTAIPKASVKLGLRPYADNTFEYLAIKNGFYAANGIQITPPPYGIKNNDQAIAQMLNGTVDMQAMYAPSLIPTYKTNQSLKQVMFTDYFNGWALLAPRDSGAKPVGDYVAQGMPFKAAMAKSLAPMKGKTLVVAPLLDNRDFVRQAFTIAGLAQPKLQILDDSKSLLAARAKRINFASPTGAPTTMQFEREGWIAVVRPSDIIEHANEVNVDVSALAATVGLASNDKYIRQHPNTVLRFISATYRLIDEIKANPAMLNDYARYLNTVTGLTLSGPDIKQIFATYDPLTDFDYGKTYCEDSSKLLYYRKAYSGIINAYVKQGAIKHGSVTPDNLIWFCGAWKQLNDFKTKTEPMLSAGKGDKALLARAKQFYDQRNYLDAYRLATAATAKA